MNEYNRADAIILCGGLGTRLQSIQPDLPKILRAKELIVHKDIEDYGEIRFKRAGEYYPMGLKQNRYVACFWERA